eukprot:5190488-Karenia_brevis.AAC.1
MFEEDVRIGHMRKLANFEAEREFGGSYTTAAIAALQKDEDSFRIIHDGTHKVRVNPQIIVRDQIAYPAVGEKTVTLVRAARRRSTMIGLKADVSKAHRRVRVFEPEQRWQLCRTRADFIWANTVGTFGIGSAGYWWGRLGGAIGRIL